MVESERQERFYSDEDHISAAVAESAAVYFSQNVVWASP